MSQKLYERTWFKGLIVMGIPTIISVVGGVTSLFTVSTMLRIVLAIFNIVLLGVFLYAVIWYSKNDDKYDKTLNDLKTDLKAKNEIVKTYTWLFENWSNKIYDFAELMKENKVSNLSWDKYEYYNTICIECCEMIKRYCTKGDNISVSFIEHRVEGSEDIIEMVADSNPASSKPKAYQKKEKLSESEYFYAKLIRAGFRGIESALDNKAVLDLQSKISDNTDLAKYSQYVATTIYCKENKLLGIFQIVTEYNCTIETEKERMEKFVTENITPYTNSILLVDKIHKGLYAKPEEK